MSPAPQILARDDVDGRSSTRAETLPPEKVSEGEHLSPQAREVFEREVAEGLFSSQKTLPCKYFYDTRGSKLFEEICETPEYYVTRTEIALLREACPEVAALAGPGVDVLEPGSGAGEKIRILLDALEAPRSFIPIDISKTAVAASAEALSRDYPGIEMHPLVADFTRPFVLPTHFFEREKSTEGGEEIHHRKMIFFPGSTISNFVPDAALTFLKALRGPLEPGDYLFIGVDRVKDKGVLERAYDDAQGITAEFNLNLLHRIRDELDCDIDPSKFSHRAVFNEAESRIEMHLVSKEAHEVALGDRRVKFDKGETIHTENSYKYTVEMFTDLAVGAGFDVVRHFSDDEGLFSLYLCEVPS